MTRKYRRTNAGAAKLFKVGQYQTFKKGDLYKDPRINTTGVAGRHFLSISGGVEEDLKFLDDYLAGELDNYPSEPFNTFTTGTDKNGESLVGLYWVNDSMDQRKTAVVLCKNGGEEEVLDIIDKHCKEIGETKYEVTTKAEGVAKVGGVLPENLAKYVNGLGTANKV